MSWFDEQIRQRKLNDDEILEATYAEIAGAVIGRRMSAALYDERRRAKDAYDCILKYYRLEPGQVPEGVEDVGEQLEFLLRPHGIMRRNVRLAKGWYKDAVGAMLGIHRESGHVVALLPGRFGGYTYLDETTGREAAVTRRNEGCFEEEAICFYKPFPLRKMTISDLLRYIAGCVSGADLLALAAATGMIFAAECPCMVLIQCPELSTSRIGSDPIAVGYNIISAPFNARHLAVSGNH